MAYLTKKDQTSYIELGTVSVDFSESDVLALESVKDISPFFPLDPKTIFFAICNEGQLTIEFEGVEKFISAGDIFHCPPKVRVSIKKHSDDFDCKVLCISDHVVRSLMHDQIDPFQHDSHIHHLSITSFTSHSRQDFNSIFAILRSNLKQNNPPTPHEKLLGLLRVLLLEMHFNFHDNDNKHHDQRLSQGKVLFNRFIVLISNSSLKRQPIAFYASQLAITPKYLTMLCLKYSNKTASEWVAQYTVEEIRFYLKNTDLSIKEISAQMGFSNMSHFGSYVRKHLGVSPSEYRYNRRR